MGTKAPYELGIYDMTGNVWEWCGDRYGAYSDLYTTTTGKFDKFTSKTNPTGPTTGSTRIKRGGAYTTSDLTRLQVIFRGDSDHKADLRENCNGFRVVLH